MGEKSGKAESINDIAGRLLVRPRSVTEVMVEEVVHVNDEQFNVHKDAFVFLETEWRKAGKYYAVDKEGPQKAFVQIALLAAGMQAAVDEGRHDVGQADIITGWKRIRVCGLDEMPHQCLGESIIRQAQALQARTDLVGKCLTEAAPALAGANVGVDALRQERGNY